MTEINDEELPVGDGDPAAAPDDDYVEVEPKNDPVVPDQEDQP